MMLMRLKGRSSKAKRPIPIPLELVRIRQEHIRMYGVAPDSLLFRTERVGVVLPSGYGRKAIKQVVDERMP
jgi:hypothetical protein